MNQQQMMAQVKKMQAEMTRAQEELAAMTVTGAAGGDAVKIEMTCEYRVTSVKVSKEAIDPDDAETLEDLLVVAVNDAVTNAKAATEKRMSSVTGGLRIPGLM
ncbi:MAG: YbaB/EbfC family nucleoid-associated protein [Vulcanimicrobiaceae bacterium]